MNKADMVNVLAGKTGLTKKAAGEALEAMLTAIVDSLKKGEKVTFTGFGTFYTKHVAERPGLIPKTKERITIPAHTAAKFRPGKALKEAVR